MLFRSQTVWPDRHRRAVWQTRTAGSDVARLGGGKMVHEVSFEGFTTQSAPWKLEAGTPNVAGVIGLSAALEWLTDYDINRAESWSRSLATLAEEALAKRPGFRSFRCRIPACWPLILLAFITAIW